MFDSDREIHQELNNLICPPIDHFDFMAAIEHVQPALWPSEMDQRFERLADENRGYAPHVFERELLDDSDLVDLVRRIVAMDPSGRYFMHMDAERARKFWADTPATSTWLTTAPIWSNARNTAAKRAAGFAFTRMRRRIRWDPFPLRDCTLCGTNMVHAVDQAFGLGVPPRWCTSCIGPTVGLPTVAEATAALRAYVAATGLIPFADEMIRCIPNDRPGHVRDVMAATRTTLGRRDTLRQNGLWPWVEPSSQPGSLRDLSKPNVDFSRRLSMVIGA